MRSSIFSNESREFQPKRNLEEDLGRLSRGVFGKDH